MLNVFQNQEELCKEAFLPNPMHFFKTILKGAVGPEPAELQLFNVAFSRSSLSIQLFSTFAVFFFYENSLRMYRKRERAVPFYGLSLAKDNNPLMDCRDIWLQVPALKSPGSEKGSERGAQAELGTHTGQAGVSRLPSP